MSATFDFRSWARPLTKSWICTCIRISISLENIDQSHIGFMKIRLPIKFIRLWLIFYRPQRSCGQGYVFTRVCDSVYGGGSPGRENPPGPGRPPSPPPGRENPPWTRQTPPGPGRPLPGSRLQNTVYERPVRILLECILVLSLNSAKHI